MLCEASNHLWLGRFSVELMRLRDGLSLPGAVSRAVHAHAHALHLRPEDAAAVDAALLARREHGAANAPREHGAVAGTVRYARR
jgi:hypothetical protein